MRYTIRENQNPEKSTMYLYRVRTGYGPGTHCTRVPLPLRGGTRRYTVTWAPISRICEVSQ